MSPAHAATVTSRPWHLWLVGIAGGLWSVMGVVSFVLTQLNVEAAMSRFPPQQREYFTSFPWWAVASWGIGVFSGLAGCLLLLVRHRVAAAVLFVALVGTLLSTLGGLFLLGGMEVGRATGGLGLMIFPVVVAAALAAYAEGMRRRGILQ